MQLLGEIRRFEGARMRLESFFSVAALAVLIVGCGSPSSPAGPEPRILLFLDQSGSSRTKDTRVLSTQGLDEVIPFTLDAPFTGRSFPGRTYTFAQNIAGGEDSTFDIRTFPEIIQEYRDGGADRSRGEMMLMGSNLTPILREASREKALKPGQPMALVVVTDGGFTDDRDRLSSALTELKNEAGEPFILLAGITHTPGMIPSRRQEQRADARKLLDLRRLLEDAGYRNFTILPAEPKPDQKETARKALEAYFKGSK
jgi:hypothetical protein